MDKITIAFPKASIAMATGKHLNAYGDMHFFQGILGLNINSKIILLELQHDVYILKQKQNKVCFLFCRLNVFDGACSCDPKVYFFFHSVGGRCFWR